VNYRTAVDRVQAALKEPTPGAAAHDLLAPRPRVAWPSDATAATVRHAAGLLLLFPLDDCAHLVLTVRGDSLGRHGGQVSLPGGAIEPGETIEEAALREAHEEVALDTREVRTLGRLAPLDIPVSGFRLHPVVASIDSPPSLHPADGEVARILTPPVSAFLDPASFGRRTLLRDGRSIEVPAFFVGGVEIWGATAMALAEFLTLLGWPGPSS
jgi:8-oxo-dGTP pyrophosphatase MutT (NUDIX family)